MNPIAAFDIESADIFLNPGDMVCPADFETDVRIWGPEKNLVSRNPGISVAGVATELTTAFYESDPGRQRIEQGSQMYQDLVTRLHNLSQTHTIVTWNGLKFDFQVLAQEAGGDIKYVQMVEEIAESHCDLMYIIFCHKGYYLALDQALQRLELSKTHSVALRDGTIINEMYGGRAPQLWAQGERDAVRTYLKGDVETLYKLAESVQHTGYLSWFSSKGKPYSIKTDLIPVSEAREIPTPDTSWMTDPPIRADFDSWLTGEKEYVSPTLL